MKSSPIATRVVPKSSFLPVLMPVLIFAAVAAVSRVAQTAPPHSVNIGAQSVGANPTEATYRGFKQVETLAGSDEPGAITLLQTLCHAPLSASGDTFIAPDLATFSPQGLLMGVAHALVAKATLAINRGDFDTARVYSESLAQIGDRVLDGSMPSVSVLQIAYRFHSAAARIQAQFDGGEARYEDSALRDMWRSRFAPRLLTHQTDANAEAESRFAAQITHEYAQARSCVHGIE